VYVQHNAYTNTFLYAYQHSSDRVAFSNVGRYEKVLPLNPATRKLRRAKVVTDEQKSIVFNLQWERGTPAESLSTAYTKLK